MTVEELDRIASYLACEWALAKPAEDDVLMWGATLAMRGWCKETIRTHMEIRAEVIAATERQAGDFVSGFHRMTGETP